MARDSPEKESKGGNTCRDEEADPYCATDQKLLDVGLAYSESTEGCGFGLHEEYENRVQFVLVGNEEQDGNRERNEELKTSKHLIYNQIHTKLEIDLRRNASTSDARLGRSRRNRRPTRSIG